MTRRPPAPTALCSVLALVAGLAGGAACSTIPVVDGRDATEMSASELLAAAQAKRAAGEPRFAAEIAEHLLVRHYDAPEAGEARWLAAECRFEALDHADALRHYRRHLDEDPFTPRAPLIAKRAYAIGAALVTERTPWFRDLRADYDVGLEALNFVVTTFPRSPHADDAWFKLGQAFHADGAYQAAADVYERLIREYPGSEWADKALYDVALSYRLQSRGAEYDVDPLLRSHAALVRYLRDARDGEFRDAAEADLLALEEEITRREQEIAAFYRERGVPRGERLHLKNATLRFPDAAAAEEAARRLALLGGYEDEASADAIRVLDERPRWRRGAPPQPNPELPARPGDAVPADAR